MNEREQIELNELLMDSSQGVNVQQITELIEAGADVNAVERRKWTSLHTAIRCGNRGIVELLLDRGANVNAVDNLDMTPLHFALKYNREELVRLLLDRGANVNAVDKKGRTPLSIVASDDYHIGYCDKPMVVRTIIAYAVLHSGITTKPECIVKNIELSKFWDDYQNEMMNVRLSNSNISLYQFLRETDENKLAGYLSGREYDEIRCSDALEYISKFPEHVDTIVSQFDKAMKRKDLLYRSDIVMNHSVDLKDFPQEMKSKITNYLTNEELRNVIRAPFSIPSQNLDNPSAEQLQAAAQARN